MNEEEAIGEDGLTGKERAYMTTPMSQMDETQKRTAIAIREKRDNKVYAENAALRVEEEANRKSQFAETV